MATIKWKGAGGTANAPLGGTWSTGSNWAGGKVPTSTDDVSFGGSDPYAVMLATKETVGSITISDPSATIDLSGQKLTAGTIINNGTIAGPGTIDASIGGAGTVDTEGGTVKINGTISGAGTYIVNGGRMIVTGDVNASGTGLTFDIGTGSLKFVNSDFTGAVNVHSSADFEGPRGTLDLTGLSQQQLQEFGANVYLENMAGRDEIKISGAETASYDYADGLLNIYGSGATPIVQLHFAPGSAPADGTDFTVSATGKITICFMAGTSIATPDGDRNVEALAIGDTVLTSDGKAAPVRWLGRQTVSTRFANSLRAIPIRIKAGALGENQPVRDLLVSPDHALFVDGILVHAGALVNDVSIVRETDVPTTFVYYHVELADHALLLAEGVPAETFIDNVDRMAFDNWAEHEALYPEGGPLAEMDLPRAKSFRQVPASLRKRLADRAVALFGAEALAA